MRWSIIRLIWLRELRDQLRDRRTLFMIAVLPLLLYPVLGFGVLQFQFALAASASTIGIVQGPDQSDNFPEHPPGGAGRGYPALIEKGQFTAFPSASGQADAARLGRVSLRIVALPGPDQTPLKDRKVDLIVSASPDFYGRLKKGETQGGSDRPTIKIDWRKKDAASRRALTRFEPILQAWTVELRKVRLARNHLPADFDEPFKIDVPPFGGPGGDKPFDLLVRVFPFVLVMWSLAGALYPAVDLCAGEKERGTMETLLISPAGRQEIVLGKFLTIWIFSAGTAFLNLVSMGLTTWMFTQQLPELSSQLAPGGLSAPALLWCLILLLPTSAFFSAISLAIGAYARSTKEGQYYLMPLFVITMPLMFLSLAPGVTLSPFYSLVPVTGVALLMQELMAAPNPEPGTWLYFAPVLAPVALYSWLALRWAIEQFKREEVLFREAERLDMKLWLRRLFREKEPTPTTGQAAFCFVLILALRWFSLTLGTQLPGLVHTGVSLLAFVATPALLMALILNTRPREGLCLRLPDWTDVGIAALLSLFLLPPLTALAMSVFNNFPDLTKLLEHRQPLVQELSRLSLASGTEQPSLLSYLLVFGVLASICEEVAFRGFILSGLLHRLRSRNAVILSSLLFALFHMNVFQFLPAFFLGVVLGLLTVRSKSLLPAIVFHLLHNGMLVICLRTNLAAKLENRLPGLVAYVWNGFIVVCLVAGLGLLWWLYREPYVALAHREARAKE